MHKKVLVLSGGGLKGILHLGSIHALNKLNKLNDIDVYIGTSVGAVICFLISIQYTPVDILNILFTDDMFKEIKNFSILSLINDNYGIYKFDVMEKKLTDMCKNKIDKDPSLLELYEGFGIHLVCTSYNMTKKCTEYLDYINNPSLNCIQAIKMSCSIPLLLPRVKYNDCYYIDGGIGDNYPITLMDDGINEVIGIDLSYTLSIPEDTFTNYIYEIVNIPIYENSKK